MIKNGGNFCYMLDFARATLAETLKSRSRARVEAPTC